MSTEADYRLPRTVVPSHYRLRLEPELASASFVGTVAIDVDIVEPTNTVVLNAIDLEIASATVEAHGASHDASWQLDAESQRVTLTLDETLEPGSAVVAIGFSGVLNDLLRGFYRSVYTDADGNEQVIATTQFEAADARRAFPCWDEPDLKATFGVTLVVSDGLAAISNAAEVSRTPLGDGRDEVVFADTVVMSTYLVAFIVGDFEFTDPVDVGGVPLRIATPPGQLHMTDFAMEAGEHALRYFADYYDVPYPGDKLDMVAIPDFSFGAMENLGCITYRETALLIDSETATQREMVRVGSVVAHEIAHMWFGDLVTMKWWNGVWLNEAFATFAEVKATAAWKPEWNMWLDFATERARSQETDGLKATRAIEFPVASPAEADGMFDVLTYEKGSSVLRMLEQYLGEETFRAGVSHYLKKHSFSNTDNEDLWASLEEVSDQPVAAIMDTWIFQGGYPVVNVASGDGHITLSQEQFRYLGGGDKTWKVPVILRSSEGESTVLLEDHPITVPVGDDVLVNAGGEGFFRVSYDDTLAPGVMDSLGTLDPVERLAVVSDAYANLLAGRSSAADYLEMVGGLSDETESEVWSVVLAGLGELDRVVSSDDRASLQSFVRDLVGPTTERLGWTVGAEDSDRDRALRGNMLKAYGNLGDDQETISQARLVEADDDASVDAEIADAALAISAAHGDLDDFERFLALSKSSPTPQLTVKYLRAAASVPHPDVPARIVDMVIRGEIRNQDSYWVLAVIIGQRDNGARAWRIVADRWNELTAVMPPNNTYRMLDLVWVRSEPDVAVEIASFLEANPLPGSEKAISQRLEQLEIRVGLREREATRIGEAIQ